MQLVVGSQKWRKRWRASLQPSAIARGGRHGGSDGLAGAGRRADRGAAPGDASDRDHLQRPASPRRRQLRCSDERARRRRPDWTRAAGCVCPARAAEATFSTVVEDHGNCSVGRVTHGLATLADVEQNGDVAALLGSGWVTSEAVGRIPAVAERPGGDHLRAAERDTRQCRSRCRPAAGERQPAHGALRRHRRVTDRGQAAMPGRGRGPSRIRSPRPASGAPSPGRGRA